MITDNSTNPYVESLESPTVLPKPPSVPKIALKDAQTETEDLHNQFELEDEKRHNQDIE